MNVFNKDDIILTAEIYNNTGQLIQSRKNIINSLDTSNLGKGYYLLSLKKPDGLLIKNIGFVVL
ncbi:MAG: T9SS type A sorting domain-containing protein [Saprospiraceae bacterium]|nr:T9SS type A sorting domain-containing protein [Saprospiraceae bacterium]